MASEMKACMTTGTMVAVEGLVRDDDVILIVQQGQVIGILSEEAQDAVRTLRMTFTRNNPEDIYQPLQGQVVETF